MQWSKCQNLFLNSGKVVSLAPQTKPTVILLCCKIPTKWLSLVRQPLQKWLQKTRWSLQKYKYQYIWQASYYKSWNSRLEMERTSFFGLIRFACFAWLCFGNCKGFLVFLSECLCPLIKTTSARNSCVEFVSKLFSQLKIAIMHWQSQCMDKVGWLWQQHVITVIAVVR